MLAQNEDKAFFLLLLNLVMGLCLIESQLFTSVYSLPLAHTHTHTELKPLYWTSFAHARTNQGKSPLMDLGVREVATKIISPDQHHDCTQEGRLH